MYDSYASSSSDADSAMAGARRRLAAHRRNRNIVRVIALVCAIASGALANTHPIAAVPFSLIWLCAAVALIVEIVRTRRTVRAIKAAQRASVSPLTSVYR